MRKYVDVNGSFTLKHGSSMEYRMNRIQKALYIIGSILALLIAVLGASKA